MTLKEAAQRLKVSVRTLRRHVEAGAVRAYRLGGVGGWRVFESDLLGALEVNE